MKKGEESGLPLFLISPPGSLEVKEMGYFNIPKIEDEPPPEFLGEENSLHVFIDKSGFEEFLDEPERPLYLKSSNVWVLKKAIEENKACYDLIVPIFPPLLKYSIRWVLCEYALDSISKDPQVGVQERPTREMKKGRSALIPLGLKLFIENNLKHKIREMGTVTVELRERTWQNAKNPIYYLLAKIETDEKFLGKRQKKVVSFESPLISGNLGDDEDPPRLIDTITSDISTSLLEHIPTVDDLERVCISENISPDACKLLKLSFLRGTNQRDASYSLGFSKKKYNALRQEILRKRKDLRKKLENYCRTVRKKD